VKEIFMETSILDLIGHTPMISLKKTTGLNLSAKAEYLNQGGSIKDRVAKHMIEQAERRGDLQQGMTIMEPTSGNTGIGIALVGIQKGYRVVIVMPENMSEERKKIILALGAELILTPEADNMTGAVNFVKQQKIQNIEQYVPNQFDNPDNPLAHYETTAPELWEQTNGRIDLFVSGLGSGGTLQGIGRFLKEKNPDIRIIAVEPRNVSALLGHEPGLHKIQGIGDGFVPSILDVSLIDDIIEVDDDDAIKMTRNLARSQGILAGTSSGANVWASIEVAKKYGTDKQIVTILPDRVERYFSTSLI
jgi:cysteine synthase